MKLTKIKQYSTQILRIAMSLAMAGCSLGAFADDPGWMNPDFNPDSPGDPDLGETLLYHPVTVKSDHNGHGYVSPSDSFKMYEGEERYIYAYPYTNYELTHWNVNGRDTVAESPMLITMGKERIDIIAYFKFNPSSPYNPGANSWNPNTGEMIIDDFTPGNLYSVVRDKCNSSLESITSLIVKGVMDYSDMGIGNSLKNAASLDFSRTSGVSELPSYAFESSNASSIMLPSVISSIGNYAFYGCDNLTSLTIYATEPPTVESNTFGYFNGLSQCTLYVPASSLPLYQDAEGWKLFSTILPISFDAHVLQVNLPDVASDGRYKNCSLEIANTATGVRQKYVISDRMLYTFNGLQKNEQYNVYLLSQAGLEIGHIENVVIPDKDIQVAFESLKSLHTVFAKVLDADGNDVTDQTTIEWLKPLPDGNATYIRKAVSINEIPEGEQLLCRATLDSKLGVIYMAPEDMEFTAGNEDNICTLTLSPFRAIELSGTVIDGDGNALPDASVSVSQTLNDKYFKTFTAKTDRTGAWNMTVLDAPETRLTFAAPECVNMIDTIGAFDANISAIDLGKTTMKSIVGAHVTYGFTYHAAGVEEKENYYSDYQNVAISVFNVTQNRAHNEISLQYPILAVLDENINAGDELRLTATSKTGSFNPIEQTVSVGENQRADVTFDIVGKGSVSASFEMTENPAVTAMLYSSNGELIKKQPYAQAYAIFTELENGDYTIVSMGESTLMNSILRLSVFDELGLIEGKDYVKSVATVESGKLTEVKIPEIPAFDESIFYYTNSSAGFSANKSGITTGNYLTLRANIDFKSVYKDGVSNVALMVDLPEACDFVDQSVIQGPNLLPYTLDNNRLTIQLGENYRGQTRFCVIPTTGGSFNASASISFDYDGKTITQPIGSAISEIKDIEIIVSPYIAVPSFKVCGMAPSTSEITIFDNDIIIGKGVANRSGTFQVDCEFVNPYNQSQHQIYAVIGTSTGSILMSETKNVTYDTATAFIKSVEMTEGDNKVIFDFENPNSTSKYYYYSFGKFTFVINFTSPKDVKDVLLYVHTTAGTVIALPAMYDESKNIWFATANFETNALPLNVSVDFNSTNEIRFDREKINQLFVENPIELKESFSSVKDNITDLEKTVDAEIEYQNTHITATDEIYSYLSEDNSTESDEYVTKLIDMLTLIVPEFDSTILEVTPHDYDDSEIDSLLLKGETLLQNEEFTGESVEKLNNDIDELLAKIENDYNQEASLEIDLSETIQFEYDGGNYTISKISIEEFNQLDLTNYENTPLRLTGDETLNIYNYNDSWIIYNNSTTFCYVVEVDSNSQEVHKLRKAKGNSIGFLENLKQQFNIANEKLISVVSDLTENFRSQIKELNDNILDAENQQAILRGKSNGKGTRVAEIERQLKELEAAGKGGYRKFDLEAQKIALQHERKLLLRDIRTIEKTIGPLKKRTGSMRVKLTAANAFLAEAMDYWQIIDGFNCIIKYVTFGIADYVRWNSFIGTILPCPNDSQSATSLKKEAENNRDSALRGYCGAFTLAGLSEAISVAMKVTAKPAGWVLKFLCGAISGALLDTAKDVYCQVSTDSRNNINNRISDRNQLQCKKEKDPYSTPYYAPDDPTNPYNDIKPNPNGGNHKSGNDDSKYGIDPSGFVYEAVPENRVEGVQASIYYKETKEDMYGDPYEDIVLWNAEEYAQKNPLFTDENGMYQWDVPQGLWQVKFEKDGYDTTFSEWLPVPPPQLEVNIGIVQNKQPEVTEARAYEEGVEVQFDKFMDLSTLTADNIYVTANGEKLSGEILMIDSSLADEYASEDDADALRYASRVRFVPEQPLSVTTGEVVLTVSRNVLSYAGIPMAQTFSQTLDVEKEVQAIVADDVKVLYGGEKEITIYALPSEAAVNRTLRIANSSDLIATIDLTETKLDDEGKAVVKVKGDLPGRTQLSFSIDDVTTTGSCAVDVVTEIITAEAPQSSRASGTAVYRGTKIALSTDTKGGVIYFTTDGSCPCDENGTRRKYTVPIVINEDTQILAMTSVGEGDDDVSETVEFNYTLKRSDMDFRMPTGWSWISHSLENAVAIEEVATAAVEHVIGQTEEAVRDPQLGLVGELKALQPGEMYKVRTNSGTSSSLNGIAINPATPISAAAGWNWLGYPSDQTMSLDEAFANTAVAADDYIVGQDGFAQFDGQAWVGTLNVLNPGMGYMYRSMDAKDIVFNTSIVSKARSLAAKCINVENAWVADKYAYPSVMPIMAELFMENDSRIEDEDIAFGAFCGSECRGVGKYVNGLMMISVYGNAGDEISFRAIDNADGQEYRPDFSVIFTENMQGCLYSPVKITLKKTTGIDSATGNDSFDVTVTGNELTVLGDFEAVDSLTIFDNAGLRVLSKSNLTTNTISLSGLAKGVHIVVVKSGDLHIYRKIVVR